MSVRDYYQDDRFAANEVMRVDNFLEPYMGKQYPDGRATEIISMGLQELRRDPRRLAKDDPDYFDFLLRAVQGR